MNIPDKFETESLPTAQPIRANENDSYSYLSDQINKLNLFTKITQFFGLKQKSKRDIVTQIPIPDELNTESLPTPQQIRANENDSFSYLSKQIKKHSLFKKISKLFG
jgi:hypothetical protein